MISPRTEPVVWRIALALCLLAGVLLGVLWATVPDDMAWVRILLAACTLALVAVTGLALAQVLGLAVAGGVRRWASLLVGGLGAAALLSALPAIAEFAFPLGEAMTVIVQLVFAVLAVGIGAIGVWGFVRRDAGSPRV